MKHHLGLCISEEHNKDYYKYINDIDEEPSFDSNGDDTDDDDDDEAGGQF